MSYLQSYNVIKKRSVDDQQPRFVVQRIILS